MKPLGRKKIQIPDAKHKPKECGRNIAGWWENIVTLSKKRQRREGRQQIHEEIQDVKK